MGKTPKRMTNEELCAWMFNADRSQDLVLDAVHEWQSNIERRLSLIEGKEYVPSDEKIRGRLLGAEKRLKVLEEAHRGRNSKEG